MTSVSNSAGVLAAPGRPRTTATLSAAAIVLGLLTITSSVNLQLPLYAAYGEASGSSHAVRALAFSTYVVALIPALALLGGISDVWGRKPVVLLALGVAASSTGVMMEWPTLQALFVARLLHGLSVAISAGTCTAYLTDVLEGPQGRARAAALTALATSVGFGGGALLTSICLACSWGTPLQPWSFPAELILLALSTLAILGVRSRQLVRSPATGFVRMPCFPAGTLPYTCAATTAWAVSGTIIALLPATLTSMGRPSWSGIALSILTGAGVLVQVVPGVRMHSPQRGLLAGAVCTMSALGLLLAAVALRHPSLLLCAAFATGLSGFGYTYVTSLTVVTQAAGALGARAVSGLLFVCYVGFGLPCVIVGLVTDRIGLLSALAGLSVLVGVTWASILLRVFSPQRAVRV